MHATLGTRTLAQRSCADNGYPGAAQLGNTRGGRVADQASGQIVQKAQHALNRVPLTRCHSEDRCGYSEEDVEIVVVDDVPALKRAQQRLSIRANAPDAIGRGSGELQPSAPRLGVGCTMFFTGLEPFIKGRPDPIQIPARLYFVKPFSGLGHRLR